MTRRPRMPRALLLVCLVSGAAFAAHEGLVLALDRAELVERLLSPSGLDSLLALCAALVLFTLRLGLLLLVPACVGGLASAWLFGLAHDRLSRPHVMSGPTPSMRHSSGTSKSRG